MRLIDYRMDGIEYILFDDSLEALKGLKEKYNIAILTNGLPSRMNEIKKVGISKYIDDIYISSLIGYEKPSKEAFSVILKEYQLATSEVLFIDDKEKNLESAKKLGFRVILMDRDNSGISRTKFQKISNLIDLQKNFKIF